MRQLNTAVAIFSFALVACGQAGSPASPSKQTSSTPKGSGKAEVTWQGITDELEVTKISCGLTRDQKSFAMMARAPNPEGSPSVFNLTIGGELGYRDDNADRLTSIRYTPPREDAITVYVTLRENDAPWIDGNRFEWSGDTNSGEPLVVEAECP